MHARGAPRKSRREISVGPVRRAHPASGATWNVQVVRGKMTSRCLWHACRALMIGIALMMLGAGMATIGRPNLTKYDCVHCITEIILIKVTMPKICQSDKRYEATQPFELKTNHGAFT